MDYGGKFLIKVASSGLSLDELLFEINRVNKDKNSVVQVFDPRRVINQMHLAGAYMDTVESFKERTNISKTRGMEMLLFAAMTNQINEAIKIVGAKSSNDFVLFANNRATFNKAKRFLKSSKELARSRKAEREIATKFGIYTREDLDKFILQKMAVSRLSD